MYFSGKETHGNLKNEKKKQDIKKIINKHKQFLLKIHKYENCAVFIEILITIFFQNPQILISFIFGFFTLILKLKLNNNYKELDSVETVVTLVTLKLKRKLTKFSKSSNESLQHYSLK